MFGKQAKSGFQRSQEALEKIGPVYYRTKGLFTRSQNWAQAFGSGPVPALARTQLFFCFAGAGFVQVPVEDSRRRRSFPRRTPLRHLQTILTKNSPLDVPPASPRPPGSLMSTRCPHPGLTRFSCWFWNFEIPT